MRDEFNFQKFFLYYTSHLKMNRNRIQLPFEFEAFTEGRKDVISQRSAYFPLSTSTASCNYNWVRTII